jgi:hypothetical protein
MPILVPVDGSVPANRPSCMRDLETSTEHKVYSCAHKSTDSARAR